MWQKWKKNGSRNVKGKIHVILDDMVISLQRPRDKKLKTTQNDSVKNKDVKPWYRNQ